MDLNTAGMVATIDSIEQDFEEGSTWPSSLTSTEVKDLGLFANPAIRFFLSIA